MKETSRTRPSRSMSLLLLVSMLAFTLTLWQPRAGYAAVAKNAAATSDSPFGVAVHLPPTTGQPPAVSSIGVTWARTDINWNVVETKAGQYDFSAYDGFMTQLANENVNPLIILDYQNPLYDNGETPYDTAGRTAFANYAKAVLNHYGPQIKAVEVWNEPNGGWFDWGQCSVNPNSTSTNRSPQTPACYTQLLQSTYQAVKSIRPDVTVVGGVTYEVDTTFLQSVFKDGGLQYMDVVSDHPYAGTPEDGTVDQQEIGLENLIKQYNNGNPKPVWATEIGWKSDSVGLQGQADDLVRSAVLALAAGVQKYFWYDFFSDDTGDPTFGLVNPIDSSGNYTLKPAATAYQVLTQQLGSQSFVRSEAIGNGLYDKLFSNNIRVMWSTAGSQPVYLKTSNPLTVTTVSGSTQTLTPVNGVVTVTLSGDPVYVQGAVSRVYQTSVPGGSGTVYGFQSAPPSSTDLTAEGRSDWASWGATSATSYDRKSSGNSQISNYTPLGSGSVSQSGGGAPTVKWSDGTPDASGTNTAGAFTAGANNGFQVTVPADTTKRAVKLYVNSWHSTGQLLATLSDESGSYLDTSISNSSGTANGVYTLVYQAASANQTLTLQWTTKTDFGGGGVVLEAATLGPAFSTGFEAGDPQPTWTSTVDGAGYPAGGIANVTGVCCGLTGPEALVDGGAPLPVHSGTQALLYSGSGTSSSAADHAYMQVFDLSGQNLVVGAGTTLSYWVDPESAANSYNYASGSNSTCAAVDLIFSDGTNLRDSGATDQNGVRAHPAYQCGHLTLDTWNLVTVNLGAVANGKTITRLDIGYDQPNVTGGYRGHFDDISVID